MQFNIWFLYTKAEAFNYEVRCSWRNLPWVCRKKEIPAWISRHWKHY